MRTLAFSLIMAVASCAPAYAQQCFPFDEIHSGLTQDYGEEPLFDGISSQGPRLMIYVNPTTGSWSAVVLVTPQCSFLVDAGKDYDSFRVPMRGQPL